MSSGGEALVRLLSGLLLFVVVIPPLSAQPTLWFEWIGGGTEAVPADWVVPTNWDQGITPSPIVDPHGVLIGEGFISVTNTTWSPGSELLFNGGTVVSTGISGFYLQGGQWTIDGGFLDVQFVNQSADLGVTSVVTLRSGTVHLRGASEPIPLGADPGWHYDFPIGSSGVLWLPNKDADYVLEKLSTENKFWIDGRIVGAIDEVVSGHTFTIDELDGPGLPNVQLRLLGPPGPVFRRGDANGDAGFDISDAVFTLAQLFIPGSPPTECDVSVDANVDGVMDISDAVFMLAALFIPGSPVLPPPGGSTCGTDSSADGLECVFAPCP